MARNQEGNHGQLSLKFQIINGMNPKITVAIIFYNSMPHLVQSIASVLNQDYADFELLLVDDGSTDGSLNYVRGLRDPRIRVISDGQNRKLNYRLNESIRDARGQYYMRMDSDDIMFPQRVSTQVNYLEAHPEVDVVGSAAISIDNFNAPQAKRGTRANPRGVFQIRNRFIHPSVCGRRTWFLVNQYDESFVYHRSQDAELWIRTANQHAFGYIEEPLLFYREPLSLNVNNYIGTQMGLLAMAHKSPNILGFQRYLWILYECAKLALVLTCCIAQKESWLIRRRGVSLNPRLAAHYAEVLKASIALPSG